MTEKHYCFNTGRIDEVWGRVHVPLARKCTLHCVYCSYRTDGNVTQDVWRPGSAADIVEGHDGIYEYLSKSLKTFPDVRIIGVSGPGDPLENMQQMTNSMNYMMPIMSIAIALIAPLGLSLYWLISNVMQLCERLVLNKVMDKKEA